jgi:hypothetical protein
MTHENERETWEKYSDGRKEAQYHHRYWVERIMEIQKRKESKGAKDEKIHDCVSRKTFSQRVVTENVNKLESLIFF